MKSIGNVLERKVQQLGAVCAGVLTAAALLLLGRTTDAAAMTAAAIQSTDDARLTAAECDQLAYVDVSDLGEGFGGDPPKPRPE